MTVRLILPGQLRELADGQTALRVDGRPRTIREAMAWLRATHPGVHTRLVTERGELRPHLNLFVDGRDVRREAGLDTPLAPSAEILVLLSVSGG